ncbi:MAG: hypothetical protein KAI79_06785 [Bacteroidales bacterium]|nr:hypothetical protein [Bacteroidales bacterium]
MEKWDLSENQYWIVIWGLVFAFIIIIGMVIGASSTSARNAEYRLQNTMIEKGYIQVEEKTCNSYSSSLVWKKQSAIAQIKD